MDKLSQEWQERFETIWEKGDYRAGSPGQRIIKRFLYYIKPGETINDYGSGTGRAAVELLKAGHKVNMIDLAQNALEKEATDLLGNGLTFTHASLWEIPKDFPRASWGFCAEVLMTLPPEKLDQVLKNIKATCSSLFLQVADWDDPRVGFKVNTIIKDADWWEVQLKKFWKSVEQIRSQETSKRYIFICRNSE
jgi:hypothetical protein